MVQSRMHIGIAGPILLDPLLSFFPSGTVFPPTLSFPLIGQLAAVLAGRGCRVTVFCGSLEVAETRHWDGQPVDIWMVPLRRKRGPYDFYRRERRALAEAMRSSGCDLIHAHWTYEFAAAAQDAGKPCLVTAHDSPLAILRYFALSRNGPHWAARWLLGARVVRRARWLTTVSDYCRRHLQQTLRPAAPCRVIHNGIGNEWLEAGQRRGTAAGAVDGAVRITTVLQGFGYRKNSQNALRAFAILRQRLPAARMTMFGVGHEEAIAGRWARRHGLAEGVDFAGAVGPETVMRHLLEATDILLHPSREESFGMAPLEAMALGLPVVGGCRSGGVPEVVGDAGVLVDVDYPQAMADALEKLARDPALCQSLGQAGRARAGTLFTFERMVEAYMDAYQDILQKL